MHGHMNVNCSKLRSSSRLPSIRRSPKGCSLFWSSNCTFLCIFQLVLGVMQDLPISPTMFLSLCSYFTNSKNYDFELCGSVLGTTLCWESNRSISIISGHRLVEQYSTLVKDNDFLLVLHPHWLWEQPTHLLHGGYCSEIKHLMCGDDHSPPFAASVKFTWNWSAHLFISSGHVV
jgi:hypothetical protein